MNRKPIVQLRELLSSTLDRVPEKTPGSYRDWRTLGKRGHFGIQNGINSEVVEEATRSVFTVKLLPGDFEPMRHDVRTVGLTADGYCDAQICMQGHVRS